jgi:hypothetical protein
MECNELVGDEITDVLEKAAMAMPARSGGERRELTAGLNL